MLAGEPPRALSARNVLAGVVRTVRREGPTVVLHVDATDGAGPGARFEVHVTPGARDALALRPGREVWLVVKTHSWRAVV
jgi:molybdopterin-binding protein